MKEKQPNKALVLIMLCLLTGTLDAIAAILISYKVPPGLIFKFIASGWFGDGASTGGNAMVLWGLLFHYLIASCWSVTYFLLYPAAIKLFRNMYITGVIYGLFTWLIMTKVILPYTNIHHSHKPFSLLGFAQGVLPLIICIGLPVALIANRYYSGVKR